MDERGYRDTTMEDIAEAVGRSRAGVYQYFGSKAEIFLLFQERLRDDMEEAAIHLNRLGPDAIGYANVRSWLAEMSAVWNRHRMTFLQGSAAALDVAALRDSSNASVSLYTELVARRMKQANVQGISRGAASYAIVAMVEQANFDLQHYALPIPESDLVDALASVVQLALFPGSLPLEVRRKRRGARPESHRSSRTLPLTDAISEADLSESANRIRVAATKVFLERGVRRASIREITTEAGVAHGTFYLYWADKAELFNSLVAECALECNGLFEKLVATAPFHDAEAITEWVDAYVGTYRRHAAVMAFWAAEQSHEEGHDETGRPMLMAHVDDMMTALAQTPQAAGVRIPALTVCLYAILGHYPYYALILGGRLGNRSVEPTLKTFLSRAFFPDSLPG